MCLRLFSSASESLIQFDGRQNFVVFVIDERQLCLEQALLCREGLEISRLAGVLEQRIDILECLFQLGYFLFALILLLDAGLIFGQRVAYLVACIEQGLAEFELGLLLLKLGYLQVGPELAVGKKGLHRIGAVGTFSEGRTL